MLFVLLFFRSFQLILILKFFLQLWNEHAGKNWWLLILGDLDEQLMWAVIQNIAILWPALQFEVGAFSLDVACTETG